MGNWKTALLEAVKEFFRTGILGGLTSAGAVVLTGLNVQTGEMAINWQLTYVVFLVTAIGSGLRAIDKFIHEWDETERNGLIPF